MKTLQMKDRSYSIKTLLRLNSSESKFPRFRVFFSFYRTKCPRILKHKRKNPTSECLKCGHCVSEQWMYSEPGYAFYKLYFGEYDKIMIRKEIQGILNKIVEDTFDLLLQDLIRVIKKVDSKLQLIEAISLLFTKALIEPNYMELYASVCTKLIDVSIQDGGKKYTFETELLNILYDSLNFVKPSEEGASFSLNDRDKKKFLNTLEFMGHLYQKKYKIDFIINELIDRMFQLKDIDFSGEGLCKILPSIATKKPEFLKQLEQFSQIKPTTSRVKFLMMDALDNISKEPCKGEILKKEPIIPLKWATNPLRNKKTRFKF